MHILLTIAFTTCFLMTSLAHAAEPVTKQPRRTPIQQQMGDAQQLKITPEYLNQQISTLKQQVNGLQVQNRQILPLRKQVNALQTQVNILKSVVQITQNGTTIHAPTLAIQASQGLALTSNTDVTITAGSDMDLESGKNLSLKAGRDITAEGDHEIELKAPEIKLEDAN